MSKKVECLKAGGKIIEFTDGVLIDLTEVYYVGEIQGDKSDSRFIIGLKRQNPAITIYTEKLNYGNGGGRVKTMPRDEFVKYWIAAKS